MRLKYFFTKIFLYKSKASDRLTRPEAFSFSFTAFAL